MNADKPGRGPKKATPASMQFPTFQLPEPGMLGREVRSLRLTPAQAHELDLTLHISTRT